MHIPEASSKIHGIYDEDVKKKTPLGCNPFVSTTISDQITTKLNIEKIEFQNPVFEGKRKIFTPKTK